MKILLITPPLLQPNTPYAATPLLAAWLESLGHETLQFDLSLALLLRLFSAAGIAELAEELELDEEVEAVYADRVVEVVAFLQGRIPHRAVHLAERGYLPEGEHLFQAYELEEQLGWGFRGLDLEERARHLCSLFLDDVADAARALDPHFGFSRYAESLAASLPHFAPMREELEAENGLFDDWMEEELDRVLETFGADRVVLTVPFPGCLYGALAAARRIKQREPSLPIAMGGGYVNTELRELKDPALFDYVDAVVLDSGFVPLQRWLETGDTAQWVRTFVRDKGRVCLRNAVAREVCHDALPPPLYKGLELDAYFGLFEQLNPVTRLWSDGRWNKLVLAHGCCWSRCAFCDTSIDYICRYDPATPATICDWMEAVIAQTGFAGFHFVDEALPPSLLEGLCDEILARNLQVEWWGNVRFENRFKTALIGKMADAGCIAVTGGLETCHDRTLKLMRKGITVEGACRVLGGFSAAGILTHAYLMYGFPTQTAAETLEALELVRRMFELDRLHSAYWHRFALTDHSEIADFPEQFGVERQVIASSDFARNEIPFTAAYDHDLEGMGEALRAAIYNYQLGVGLDLPVTHWVKA